MGIVNCCQKAPNELVLETQGSNSNDFIKDKDENPHDSDPTFRVKKNEERISNNQGINLFSDENNCQKIEGSTLNKNAYEVQIFDNLQVKENVEENKNEEIQEKMQNEEVNVKIPLSDKNLGELINNENLIINNNEQIELNDIDLKRRKNPEDINLISTGIQNYFNYNQVNERGDNNQYYGENDSQLNFVDINLNQYNIKIDNNHINYNNLSAANSNLNFTAEEEKNLNNINIFNSEFTFGEHQQLKDSIVDSYLNQAPSITYNYDYFPSEDKNKLY